MMRLKEFLRNYFDPKLSLILLIFYGITICLNLIKVFTTAYLKDTPLQVGKNFHYQIYILDAVVVMCMMQLIAMHTKKLILKHTSWKKILLLHFFLALFIGVVIQAITDWYRLYIGIFESYDFNNSLRIFISVIDINFLVYFAMLFIIYTYYYFKIIRKSEMQQNRLEAQLMATKLNMLKTQLQPHFLFNTINSIIGLIDIDKRKAQDTLVDLSELFRQVTKNSTINLYTLKEELELLNHYIAILKVRFPDTIEFIIDIEDGMLNEMVPTMLFQPLIENAINHGYENSKGHFVVQVNGNLINDKMVFVIGNNGPLLGSKSNTSQTGVGVTNLEQRLKNIYEEASSFILKNRDDLSGVENRIEIPISTSNSF